MPDEVAKLTAVFEADTTNLEAGIARTDGGLSGLAGRVSDTLSSAGSAFTGIGRNMLTAAAPMVAGLALVVNSAMGFQTQMTNIQAVTGMTGAEIQSLGDDILDVESKFSNIELSGTFYDIAGSVTDATQRMPIFNAAIATAEAGNANLQATTSALTTVLNSYGSEAITAGHASDLMTRMVGMGVGTMDQFAAALPGVIGLAASTGVSFDEIASSMAFLTTKGNTPADAVTQLSAAMVSLLNPNETMKDALEELGVANGEALIQMYGLSGALTMVADTSVVADQGLAKTLGSVEALRATTALTADTTEDLQVKMGNFEINLPLTDLQKFNAGFREGVDNATAMAQAVQMGDTAAQISLVKNEINDLAIIAGQALLPTLFDLTREVRPVAKAFASFAKENPRLIQTIALVTAGLVGLGAGFVVLGSILSGAATVIGMVGGAIAFLLSPVGLVVAGIVALGAAIAFLASNNILGLGDAFKSLWAGMQEGLGVITNFGSGLLAAFQSGGVTGAIDYLKGQLIIALTSLAGIAVTTGTDIVNGISAGVSQAVPKVSQSVKAGAAALGPAFASAMVQQGPEFARGAGEMTKAVEEEGPKVSRKGGVFAGLLVGEFVTGMIQYGPMIAAGVAIIGYHMVAGLLNVGGTVLGIALNIGASFAAGFFAGIIFRLPGIWTALEGQFNTLIGTPIKNWFNGMAQDAAEGWKNGFGLSNIGDWVKGEYEKMVTKVKEFLGIASPSTVFVEIGKNVGQGFINGVGAILGGLAAAAQSMYDAVKEPLNAMIELAAKAAAAVGGSALVSTTVGAPIAPTVVGGTGTTQDVLDTSLGLPGRASGGNVYKGSAYVVGEDRPELFVPSTSGRIVPNLDMLTTPQGRNSDNGTTVYQFNGPFNFNGIQDLEGIMDGLGRLAKQKHRNPLVVGNY